MAMTADDIRAKYLAFFKTRGHAVVPSASLIPENDPTVLFTTAGMHPLVPYLMGEKHPGGDRVTSVQKCIRTGDIDEVGDDTHLTFFEMLGNWSFGAYFKEDAIKYSWEFLTSPQWLNIDKDKLAVTVFAGDDDAPRDEKSAAIWQSLGVTDKRIAYLAKEDNWWGPAGQTGPCGPDTEMFYWTDDEPAPEVYDPKDKRWVEIWNDVFMQYNKQADGSFIPLKQQNVDTGMGLERTLAVLNGKKSVYETELFLPILQKVEELSGKKYQDHQKEFRIIADHIKAAVMILGDNKGVIPSNVGQGYVLRRLIRRAVFYGNKSLLISDAFTYKLVDSIVDIYKDIYPEVVVNQKFIIEQLENEEKKFVLAIKVGVNAISQVFDANGKKISKAMEEMGKTPLAEQTIKPGQEFRVSNPIISGAEVVKLYSTHGVPIELIKELAREKGFIVSSDEEIELALQKHQELSRTASAGMFKGGLADASVETTRLHTAAHLMLEALRRTLGDHVQQKGSNITAERLRFDFSHAEKMTPEQIKQVEEIVNEQIDKKIPVHFKEMTVDEAKEQGATGVFEHKYGEKVKVYFIGDFSKEICGGPHVSTTGQLGHFKIIKEEASSAGVRRIKARLS